MKKLYMYMVIIFSIMILPINVKALTQTQQINKWAQGYSHLTLTDVVTGTYSVINDNGAYSAFVNYGEGRVIFGIGMAPGGSTPNDLIVNFFIQNDRDIFACETATVNTDVRNDGLNINYGVNCPVNFTDGYGFKRLLVTRSNGYHTIVITPAPYATFVSKDNVTVDTSSIVSAQSQTINAISAQDLHDTERANAIINNIITSGQGTQNAINNQTQQQAQQHSEIMNSNNTANTNDFISFATNYVIDDKTGTKSFLNIIPNFLNQLNNGTCTTLTLTIPFLSRNNQLTIPCMVDFLIEHGFGTLIRIYQFVIGFIVSYWLCVNWFKLFKETIDPFNYRIEVMDL